jgi:hypothetical protein
MSSKISLLALGAGLVLVGPVAAWADGPHPVNSYWFEPNDLKATEPPGPQLGADGTGDDVVIPPRRLDQSALNDPHAVRWPTLDKSEFEALKGYYKIMPQGWVPASGR